MDIVEYVETVLGLELLDYQKALLRDLYEEYKNKKDIRIIMRPHIGRNYFYTYLKQNNLPICKELTQSGKTLDSNN